MGFTKETALREISVKLGYEVRNIDTGINTTADVVHVFSFPTTAQREKFQQDGVMWKGRRAKTKSSRASWNLWIVCMIRVEGYDDIPNDATRGDIINYFKDDDVCRLHVEDAVGLLWENIGADEGEFEKKSEPSSEE